MTLPNFFIVGAPKCGTTALSVYLREHPQVFIPAIKEPHYFASDFSHYRKSLPTLESYLDLFRTRAACQNAVGEASVWYLYSRAALPAIRAFNPAAKIIVMIRNPVDLVQSIHSQLVWTRDEDETSLQTAWGLQKSRLAGHQIPSLCREPAFLQYGAVASLGLQVERLFTIFPRDQVKIVNFDELSQSPRATYLGVLSFLGVAADNRDDFPKINANKKHKSLWLGNLTERPPATMIRLLKLSKRLLGYEKLGFLDVVRKVSTVTTPRPPLESKFARELAEFFRDDVAKLEGITETLLVNPWLGPLFDATDSVSGRA